jgi:hypothetical protein
VGHRFKTGRFLRDSVAQLARMCGSESQGSRFEPHLPHSLLNMCIGLWGVAVSCLTRIFRGKIQNICF